MKFLPKNKIDKTVLVISDIHLGAGRMVNGQKNFLEDFHQDSELVEFLEFYSSKDYVNREVELVINGDLFDLLAVPYVPFFDDEYWSEEAGIAKLQLILDAHEEVMQALNNFLSVKKKKIVFIIGNHDAELLLPGLQELLLNQFDLKNRERFIIWDDPTSAYIPEKGIHIKHGHEYEIAHHFSKSCNILHDSEGKRYFLPPWGSYYVTRVINKFKQERGHINAIRPIKMFIINGLIYDTLFTIRFLLATSYYFIMIRFIYFFKQEKNLKKLLEYAKNELDLFNDYESLTKDYIEREQDLIALIVGHTHHPIFRPFDSGKYFINSGTWTYMHYLDFNRSTEGKPSYVQVDFTKIDKDKNRSLVDISLQLWRGQSHLPYMPYTS